MSGLSEAIDRMDVLTFGPQQVMVLRTSLAELHEKINPPKDKADSDLLEKVMELETLFEKWWQNGKCGECGGEYHKHGLSCSVFQKLMKEK